MQRHERVIRGQVTTEHLVQLFDDAESLGQTVGDFLLEGWQRGELLLVVARQQNWTLVSRRLAESGCPVEASIASGEIVVLDALATLATFVRNGSPVPERFAASVGSLVARLATQSRTRLRIYGEMVDILAAQGALTSAIELEQLWNELGTRYSFTLLCGYAAGHFGNPRTASLLREICNTHDHATAKPSDLLASWMLADRQSGVIEGSVHF